MIFYLKSNIITQSEIKDISVSIDELLSGNSINLIDWNDLSNIILNILNKENDFVPPFSHLVIEESQDFNESELRLAINLVKKENLKMLLQIHDELIFETSDNDLKQSSKLISDTMMSVKNSELHSFSIPLLVDINSGNNWGELH